MQRSSRRPLTDGMAAAPTSFLSLSLSRKFARNYTTLGELRLAPTPNRHFLLHCLTLDVVRLPH